MGRMNTNATSENQQVGLDQFQEFHQTPPHRHEYDQSQDLYGPPTDDQYNPPKPKKSSAKSTVKPNISHETQPFPPISDCYDDDDDMPKTQAFPPPQPDYYNDEQPGTQVFPPPQPDNNDEQLATQAFPPMQFHQGYGYGYDNHSHNNTITPQQQQPNINVRIQNLGQPVGGIPVGMSPSPLLAQQELPLTPQPWKTHLFECFREPQIAIVTLLFPCITFGQIAEIVDSGSTSCGAGGMYYGLITCCLGMPCLLSCTYRSKLRGRFGLMESPLPDCLVHCFCEYCALCQEYRELKERNLDPSIGWAGIVARQKQQLAMAAPMHQRMM